MTLPDLWTGLLSMMRTDPCSTFLISFSRKLKNSFDVTPRFLSWVSGAKWKERFSSNARKRNLKTCPLRSHKYICGCDAISPKSSKQRKSFPFWYYGQCRWQAFHRMAFASPNVSWREEIHLLDLEMEPTFIDKVKRSMTTLAQTRNKELPLSFCLEFVPLHRDSWNIFPCNLHITKLVLHSRRGNWNVAFFL